MLANIGRLISRRNYKNATKLFRQCSFKDSPQLREFRLSSVAAAKIFRDTENAYCFNIIETLRLTTEAANKSSNNPTSTILKENEFNKFMDRDWRSAPASEIVAAFRHVQNFCNLNRINFSDHRFDKLVDGFLDHVEKLSDSQLIEVLDAISDFPECVTVNAHNFHDLWSALDDVCCWRLKEWDTQKMFDVANVWYKLNLGKVCDFINEGLVKLARKPIRLTTAELVNVFFLLNVCRKRSIDFEFEAIVEERIEEMTLDQMAIVALGYFKTQSKVKIPHVLSVMMRKAMDTDDIHEITLCAILKAIRYSSHPNLSDQICTFLDHLAPKMSNLSTLCLLHIALLGTTLQIKHEPTLKATAQRIAENAHNVHEVRLKDMERLLLPLVMFDYDPKTTPDIYTTIMQELHETRRQKEIIQHPRCLPCALQFLAIRGMYSNELMNRVLDNEFLIETYGKSVKLIPREIFTLDINLEIDCPDYKGNRLPAQRRYKAAKWLSTYTPTHDQMKRISAADKIILDVIDLVQVISGGKMKLEHLLPQYNRADIVLCKDKVSGAFVQPSGFDRYTLGDVMKPPNMDKYNWYAVVVIGWNNTIRYSSDPVGYINAKLRHLGKIGYKAVPVIWNEYMMLSKEMKVKYICDKLT